MIKTIFLTANLMLFSTLTMAASHKDTSDVNIELVSVWTSDGDVLVQTNPRHDISGLTCTDNYWLVLDKSAIGYETTLSMLLAAQASSAKVTVRASDDNSHNICRLSRLVIHR